MVVDEPKVHIAVQSHTQHPLITVDTYMVCEFRGRATGRGGGSGATLSLQTKDSDNPHKGGFQQKC